MNRVGELVLVGSPKVFSYQLVNQLGILLLVVASSVDRERIAEVLLFVWVEAGWIVDGGGYKSIHGWEFDFTLSGLEIVCRVIGEENERLERV